MYVWQYNVTIYLRRQESFHPPTVLAHQTVVQRPAQEYIDSDAVFTPLTATPCTQRSVPYSPFNVLLREASIQNVQLDLSARHASQNAQHSIDGETGDRDCCRVYTILDHRQNIANLDTTACPGKEVHKDGKIALTSGPYAEQCVSSEYSGSD